MMSSVIAVFSSVIAVMSHELNVGSNIGFQSCMDAHIYISTQKLYIKQITFIHNLLSSLYLICKKATNVVSSNSLAQLAMYRKSD